MEDIKKLRLEKNMTQQQLADKANISLRQLVRIEKGQSFPSLETKLLIYKALEIDQKDILDYIIKNYLS